MTNDPSDGNVPYSLNELYFYLTDTCNLYCRHCWIEPRYCPEEKTISAVDRELFTAILDQAEPLGTKGVKLTGGEPLLHPQIDELLDIIRQRRLRLTVETNGTLCTSNLAERIAACERAFAPSVWMRPRRKSTTGSEARRGVSQRPSPALAIWSRPG